MIFLKSFVDTIKNKMSLKFTITLFILSLCISLISSCNKQPHASFEVFCSYAVDDVIILNNQSKNGYASKWILPNDTIVAFESFHYRITDRDTGMKKIILIEYSKNGKKQDTCLRYVRIFPKGWSSVVEDGVRYLIYHSISINSPAGSVSSSYNIFLSGSTLPTNETSYSLINDLSLLNAPYTAYVSIYTNTALVNGPTQYVQMHSLNGTLKFIPAKGCVNQREISIQSASVLKQVYDNFSQLVSTDTIPFSLKCNF
jgi:hypothetical protein